MEKIIIDKDKCIGCGLCVHSHPEYIVFDEMGQADPVGKEILPTDKPSILETKPRTTVAFRIFSNNLVIDKTILKIILNIAKTMMNANNWYKRILNTTNPSNVPPKLKNGKWSDKNSARGFFNTKDKISPSYINLKNPKYIEIDNIYYTNLIIINYISLELFL